MGTVTLKELTKLNHNCNPSVAMKSMNILQLFASTAFMALGVNSFGCNATTKPDFDPSRYLGDWYQMEGTTAFFSPAGSHCVLASYSDRGDGTVGVHNVVTKEGATQPNDICGYATIPNIDKEPGHLEIHFQDVPVAGDYRVLDTDYDNWAAVYSCNDWDLFGFFEYTYILTRSQTRDETAVSAAKDVFKREGISLENTVLFPSGPDCTYDVPNSCNGK